MPNMPHIVHTQPLSLRLLRSRWLLGMALGIASGVLVGWWLVS